MHRRSLIFALFAAAYFLSFFFRSANAVIAGDLRRDLALTPEQLGLMTSLFYASFAAIQLPLGAALDRFGARWVTPTLMLASMAGCLVFASAHSFATLALGRALIGVGMAGVLMGAYQVFGQWFTGARIATVASLMVGLGSLGGPFAATPLAWLNASFGWRAIFSWGALAVVASAAALMLGVRPGPRAAPRPAVAAGGFGLVFRDIRFWRIAVVNFFQLGVLLALQGLWGGPYLLDVVGLSRLAAGNVLLAMAGGVVLGNFGSGWLADRFGAYRVIWMSMLMFVLGLACLALPLRLPVLALGPIYFAVGFAGAFNIIQLAQIRALFPPHMSGRAVTAVNLFGFSGAALIQAGIGLVIGAFAPDAQGHYPVLAYATAFGGAALCAGLALAWYLPVGRAARPQPAETDSSGVRTRF